MRNFINTVRLYESVDFHPSEVKVENGETYIGFPSAGTSFKEVPCMDCQYEMEDGGKDAPNPNCPYCHGTGKEKETVYNFPMLNVSNSNAVTVAELMGFEDEDGSGLIENSKLPEVMRRLIRIKNGDTSYYERPSSEEGGNTYVDNSGSMPQIKTRAKMIDLGLSRGQIEKYVNRLIEIVSYAQQHGIDVSWA